jgi:glycosyltransferase involved in cell wall biosynthesis
MHVGILTDYPVASFANGPSLATQALKRYLEGRGHRVTIVGPQPGAEDPPAQPGSVLLGSFDFRAHPGVRIPFPWPLSAFDNSPKFDVIHSHSNSLLMHWAPMMRQLHGIPCVGTNTIYLPAFAQHLLPDRVYRIETARNLWSGLSDSIERKFAACYNAGDGLIVQCMALAEYWQTKGTLTVPLHVIPRPIDVVMFDRPLGADPFRPQFAKGKRLVTVGRHAREKDIDKVIKAFAQHVLPLEPQASLTLVGDGMEHAELKRLADKLGILGRCDFVGERAHKDLRDFYGHADVFAYASLSETYGQVISEALWCGVPVVALDDKMGVAYQCASGHDSLLIQPGASEIADLGAGIRSLLQDAGRRAELGQHAAARARTRVAPDVVYAKYEHAYEVAVAHLRAHPPQPTRPTRPGDAWRMMSHHVWPWLWQHTTLCTVGLFRGAHGYQTPKHLRLDAVPDTPTKET